jgi:hypothetical protein
LVEKVHMHTSLQNFSWLWIPEALLPILKVVLLGKAAHNPNFYPSYADALVPYLIG